MLLTLLGLWTHALAAVGFVALAAWRVAGARTGRGGAMLVGALAATALWAWVAALEPAAAGLAPLAETARNLAWLGFLAMLMSGGDAGERQRGAGAVLVALAGLLAVQAALDLAALFAAPSLMVERGIGSTTLVLRMTAAAGALILVHNVYGQAAPQARGAIRLPMLGLAVLWAYDLNLYTVAVLFDRWPAEMAAMRGAAAAAAIPFFALVRRDGGDWRLRLSRAATFQSLSLVAICAYFLVMALTSSAGEATGWAWLRGAQVALLALMTAAAAVLIPSGRARAWLRVTLTKHLFQHRYDYRAEWLRFTRLMGEVGEAVLPLGERVVQAVADIVEAPSGLLLVPEDGGRFGVAARWNWTGTWNGSAADAAFAASLRASGRIVDFTALRSGKAGAADRAVAVPAGLFADAAIWAGVPLIHDERLVGLVLLSAPPHRRAPDWEDFDLLRTAARGAASYLAEARGQEALAQAMRFDEFNRRFAFILHDIKNVVSGLSLVARNAERHAENPEFRADMVATLRSSVERMNDLLARLSPRPAHAETRGVVALGPLITKLVAGKRRRHDVRLLGAAGGTVLGDAGALAEALGHLVDNAIDASTADAPVLVSASATGGDVSIIIADRGAGMSADFVRTQLFQPFASTRAGGFGIGAHQARTLVAAMGGRIEVDSREGAGTRFVVTLPAAPAEALAA